MPSIQLKALLSGLDEQISSLTNLKSANDEHLSQINSSLNDFFVGIDSKSLFAKDDELIQINSIFERMHSAANAKARKLRLTYSPPMVRFEKEKDNSVKIRILAADTTVKAAPAQKSAPIQKGDPTVAKKDFGKILRREETPAPPESSFHRAVRRGFALVLPAVVFATSLQPSSLSAQSADFPIQAQSTQVDYVHQELAGVMDSSYKTKELKYQITALKEEDVNIVSYLANGTTDTGYWYQAGLNYNKGHDKFYLVYDLFDAEHKELITGKNRIDFDGKVNDGDKIVIGLAFDADAKGFVTAYAVDQDTHAKAKVLLNSHGTSFVGGQKDTHYFTGPMTETQSVSIGQASNAVGANSMPHTRYQEYLDMSSPEYARVGLGEITFYKPFFRDNQHAGDSRSTLVSVHSQPVTLAGEQHPISVMSQRTNVGIMQKESGSPIIYITGLNDK